MALRILQFGIVFAIGFYLGPASPIAGAADISDERLYIHLEDPKDVTVGRGQSATLRCNVKTSESGLNITWLYNDVPISTNDTKRFVQNDGSLYFPKIGNGKKSKAFTGEYRCRASVQNFSIISNPARLSIASFGDFDPLPSNLTVSESQPLVLFCKIKSNPPAAIEWELNTKPLSSSNSRYVPLPTGALLILKTEQTDAGAYRCIATNNLLKKIRHSKIIQLNITAALRKTAPLNFLPLDVSSNTTLQVGENLNLYCAVSGWPTPNIQWINNNSIVISNSSILHMRNMSLNQSGNFTCIAYNSGDRIMQKFSVNVYQMPYFNITPNSSTYLPAKTARLNCHAIGIPEPKITWLKNGAPLKDEARIKIQPTGLVIGHSVTSDAGIYQCIASNAVGRVSSAALLLPSYNTHLSPPTNVECRSFDDTSICLNWKSPVASPLAFTIHSYYMEMGRQVQGAEFVVTNRTYYLVSQLKNSTNYTFYIRLYLRSVSDFSKEVTCMTGVKGRRNLTIVSLNETSAMLTWSKISTDRLCNGTDLLYRVQWKRKGSESIASEYTPKTKHAITGLIPSIEYDFRVLASPKPDCSSWISFTLNVNSSL